VYASLTPDHKYLNVAVVNATESQRSLDLNVAGVHLAGPSKQWLLTGASLDAANQVGHPQQLEIKEIAIGDPPSVLTAAPISISIYRFPVAQ
jgi:alpha-N-arabinofuranosidase